MDTSNIDILKNQIWTTRTSRVNAEKRIMEKEHFTENINIYYSCLLVIYSIIPFVCSKIRLGFVTLFLTVLLTISIVYIKGLKYKERARDYRKNYTELQKLEFRLSHIKTDEELCKSEIENEYCKLLDSTENHISFDYYKTVMESSGEYKKNRLTTGLKRKYILGVTWRFTIKLLIVILPIVLALFSFLVSYHG